MSLVIVLNAGMRRYKCNNPRIPGLSDGSFGEKTGKKR